MMGRLATTAALAALGVAATSGCRDASRAPPPAAAEATGTATAAVGGFTQIRLGARPVYRAGPLHVYISPSPADLDLGLPGVAFGGADGPRYGLLGGYFAPQVLAPDSRLEYRADIQTEPGRLRIKFFDKQDRLRLHAEVLARAGRPQVVLHGTAQIAAPADRVQVFGFRGGAPSFSRALAAGREPSLDTRAADRVEVRSKKGGHFTLVSTCPRVHIVSLVPRGSTSTFVLTTGDQPPPEDPLFAPPAATSSAAAARPLPAGCLGTVTSTLSLPTPG